MKNDNNDLPIIHVGAIELHGDLYFASIEHHDMAETLPVIHNYALTYALDLCTDRTGRKSKLYDPTERRKQRPKYKEDFDFINKKGIYITPAKVEGTLQSIIRQYASRIDEYVNKKRMLDDVLFFEPNPTKRRPDTLASIFPLYGFMKVIATGTRFIFFAYGSITDIIPLKRYIRLGNFLTKAYVELKPCKVFKAKGPQFTTQPLNVIDCTDILPYDYLFMRPTNITTTSQLYKPMEVVFTDPWDTSQSKSRFLPANPIYRYGERI